ncbi:hypothetical protein KC19_VG160000 [Ceratodon purpureus]|uniref:Uncharacterized protein n=1 Tax=Ceratodon purpureus TaxID=3225 RepID=A0A8T0HR27_CERPU|nr:hypothetical protein KC19_VG160000 [Ceratodon purpureus]
MVYISESASGPIVAKENRALTRWRVSTKYQELPTELNYRVIHGAPIRKEAAISPATTRASVLRFIRKLTSPFRLQYNRLKGKRTVANLRLRARFTNGCYRC